MSTQAPLVSLIEQLDEARVEYQLIHHDRTETAAAEAAELGISPSRVVKTVVLATPTSFIRAAVPASERLDLHKVRDFLGLKDVELATESVLAGAYPGFELGAVPPIGGPGGDLVLIDHRLLEHSQVVIEGGEHDASLLVETTDLIEPDNALVADICRD